MKMLKILAIVVGCRIMRNDAAVEQMARTEIAS
jgi:hypothetical protein